VESGNTGSIHVIFHEKYGTVPSVKALRSRATSKKRHPKDRERVLGQEQGMSPNFKTVNTVRLFRDFAVQATRSNKLSQGVPLHQYNAFWAREELEAVISRKSRT